MNEFEDKENYHDMNLNRIPKKSSMKTKKMLMKIPKETNFSNKRSSNYFSETQKTDYIFSSNKYSTVTPVRGKFIKQLEEYSCEPDETIKMFEKYDNDLNDLTLQKSTVRAHRRDFTQLEKSKEFQCSGLKLLHLKKIPPQQLELNPSVDSTPRGISATGVSLTSSFSSIFLSPVKLERVCHNNLVKIREKVLKSNSEISRELSSISADYSNISKTTNFNNFFKVQQVEEKLWKILQKLDTNNDNVSQLCEDWWEVSQDMPNMIYLSQFFADSKQK